MPNLLEAPLGLMRYDEPVTAIQAYPPDMAKKRDSGRCGIPFGLLLLKTPWSATNCARPAPVSTSLQTGCLIKACDLFTEVTCRPAVAAAAMLSGTACSPLIIENGHLLRILVDELPAILLGNDYSLPGDKPIRIGPAEYPG